MIAGVFGVAFGRESLAAAGLAAATALAGAFAAYVIVSERRRHEVAEDRLQAQAAFLESLLQSLAAVSRAGEPGEILERTAREAGRLFATQHVRLSGAEDDCAGDVELVSGDMRVPLAIRGEPLATLELRRTEPFGRADMIGAAVLADFASRAVENARLLAEARERERERARLTERLITAEQDERRRLSIFLHDGPLQSMSGIALMHDAALAAIREGRHDVAADLVESSLERERNTIRTLRDLSFAIEPLVLRDQGFAAAVKALGEQIEESHVVTVSADVEPGERLGEKAQVALYQLIREALNQAVRREPTRIDITVEEADEGTLETEIADDGMGERRRAGIQDLEERVRVLNGHVAVDSGGGGGTRLRVVLPGYVASPR
ncbi:MAG: histidine kinase [Actinomycetota bacterium]|nr:histidine kinase [Actinomycetota bacterium]